MVLFHQELQHLYTGDGFHADVELGELGSGVFVAFDGQAELVDQALGLQRLFGLFGQLVQQGQGVVDSYGAHGMTPVFLGLRYHLMALSYSAWLEMCLTKIRCFSKSIAAIRRSSLLNCQPRSAS
ncbi:hypothetical protein D3C81_1527640 [compost metagenome]